MNYTGKPAYENPPCMRMKARLLPRMKYRHRRYESGTLCRMFSLVLNWRWI